MHTDHLVSRSALRDHAKPNYIIPVCLLVLDWLIIVASMAMAHFFQSLPAYLLAIAVIGGRQHALFILVHEGVHKHMARKRNVNDLLSDFAAAYPVMFDTLAYRRSHLKHHEHLNTDNDPDWIRKKDHFEWSFPVTKLRLLSYMPYFVLVRGPLEWLQIVLLFSGIFDKNTYMDGANRRKLISKIVFWGAVLFAVGSLRLWTEFLLLWIVPLFFVFPILQRTRSIAEHFGISRTAELNSTREVVSNWLERSFLAPHSVNFHLSHHLYPGVPCYRLKGLHTDLMQNEKFAGEAHINPSYILGKNSVLRDITRPAAIDLRHHYDDQSHSKKAEQENHEFRNAS